MSFVNSIGVSREGLVHAMLFSRGVATAGTNAETQRSRDFESYLKTAKEDGCRARETGDGSRSFLGNIVGGY